jgi:UDP-glucose 4-epimerase
MKILVTGGAGYIGSITVKYLINQGHDVVVFDNLVYGHRESINCPLIVGDLEDKEFLFNSLKEEKFDGVIHFAAYALAGESMQNPYKYFYSNLTGGLNLLEFMSEKQINNIIFSSSCSIYGAPEKLPVTEDESKKPESVYGESKLMFEKILGWYDKVKGVKHINLRYFNAAGAALDGSLGEDHDPETHIIPIAIKSALNNIPFPLFGDDYETPDGTCVRDYIHVEDLAVAHLQALNKVIESGQSDSFNLGKGQGYSNLEVIEMIKKISRRDIVIEKKARRFGDPSTIYADNTKARKILNFDPKYSDLETIIKTAWKWHSKHD